MRESLRTTVVLSRELVKAVDQIVGARRRSQYVEEAVAERVRRDRQLTALRDPDGALNPDDYRHWATPGKTSVWVRSLRRAADAHSREKVRRRADHDPASA